MAPLSSAGQSRVTLEESWSIQQRFPMFGSDRGSLLPIVSATPRFSKEPAWRRLRNEPQRGRVVVPRLGHHEPKPERGEGGNTGQGQKGAIIAHCLDNHPTDGIAQRRPDAGGRADRAVSDVEAASAAGEIG